MRRRWTGLALLTLLFLARGSSRAAHEGLAAERSRRARAYHLYSLAQQSLLQRDYADAIALMEHAAARDGSADLLLEVAKLHLSLNNLPRAAELTNRVLGSRPGSSEAQMLLGEIHLSWARAGHDSEANLTIAVEAYRAALASEPSKEEICLSLAELLYQTGELEEARDRLRTFARGQSLGSSGSLLLAKVHVRMGQPEDAQVLLERIVAGSPLNLEAADTLGWIYESKQMFDAAVAVYEPLLRSGQKSGYVHARIGSLHLQAGRYHQAIERLQEAERLDPEDADQNRRALARAYEEAGELTLAIATYERMLRSNPEDLEAGFQKARLQESQGETAAALENLRSIVTQVMRVGAIREREASVLALAYSQIGLMEMEVRNLAAAAEAFERALDVSVDPSPDLFLLLGRARQRLGDLGETDRVLAEAIRRYPDDLDLLVLKGEVLLMGGDGEGGRKFFRSLLESLGGSAEIYLRIGEALLRQRSSEESESILREGTERFPLDDKLLFARGAALERLGRLGEAEQHLLHAIGLNPGNAMALNYLGYMLADRGMKLHASVGYVERALKLDPENPAYLDSFGWALFKLARYAAAEDSLRAAVSYDRHDPTIREHLGDLLMATGRPEEAVVEWEEALSRGHQKPERIRRKMEDAKASIEKVE